MKQLNTNDKSSQASRNNVLENNMREYAMQLSVDELRNNLRSLVENMISDAQMLTDPVKTMVRENDGNNKEFKGM